MAKKRDRYFVTNHFGSGPKEYWWVDGPSVNILVDGLSEARQVAEALNVAYYAGVGGLTENIAKKRGR